MPYTPSPDAAPQWLRDTAAFLYDLVNGGLLNVSTQGGNAETAVNITQTYSNATNGAGDYDGTGNPETLFNVGAAGPVLVAIVATCQTTLTGASATLAVGNATTAARYLPQITGTNFSVGKSWDITGIVSAGTAPNTTPNQVAQASEAIIATVGTADVTAGKIQYFAFWVPLVPGATLTAASPITA